MAANAADKKVSKVSGSGFFGSLSTLYHRRWLAGYFVQRELASSYRGSYLGFAWAFLSPLFMIALYTLIFSEIIGLRFREVAGDSTLNFGLYLYCGLIPFLAFSDAVNGAINSIRRNTALVQKVVFPLEILPATKAVSTVVDKLFGLAVLIAVVGVIEGRLNWTILLFPVIFAVQLIFTLGLSYLFAVVGTYLPDVREMLRSVVRVSFFATPIIWPKELAEERGLGFLVDYNPLAFLVGAYRNLVLDGEFPDPTSFILFSLFATALFVIGFAVFARVKRQFPDLL